MAFIGCGEAPVHDHGEEDHDPAVANNTQDGGEEVVHLLQKQMDVMGIELGHFQFLDLTTTIRANGHLELPPQNKASLGAVMEGRVKSIEVVEGEKVSKGKVLAYLEHPAFIELQQEYLKVKSRLKFLEQNYARKKALYEDSISSAKAFQSAEADLYSAQADLQGLTAKLEMLGLDVDKVENGELYRTIPIRSPIEGFVRSIDVNIGTYVQPHEEIFEIVDNEHIHIDLRVYEKDMAKVKNGQKVIFTLANKPDSLFEGSIFAVGKSFEQEPKAMLVHAEIDNNTGDLLPGMYVDARIITELSERSRALPNEAIVKEGGLSYIFVLKKEEHVHAGADDHGHEHGGDEDHSDEYLFRIIEVNTGAKDISFTEVVPTYDIPQDSKIVTKGAFYLLAELRKGEGGHGHHH